MCKYFKKNSTALLLARQNEKHRREITSTKSSFLFFSAEVAVTYSSKTDRTQYIYNQKLNEKEK
jgi:hypothetical protein